MKLLYPSDAEERAYRYRIEKISGLLFLCAAGTLLALLITVAGWGERRVTQDGRVIRNPYGGGNAELKVEADTGEKKEELVLNVEERKYTRMELEEMIVQVRKILEDGIKGGNRGVDEITEDLYLPYSVDGYPFRITWESGDYGLIGSDGSVNNEEVEAPGRVVELTATFTYFDSTWKETFPVRVCPPRLTHEEAFRRMLQEEVRKKDKAAEYEEAFFLPGQVEGAKIVWKERTENSSLMLFAIFLLAGAAQYLLPDEKLKKELEDREHQMLLAYPEFISKLVLLMGAGLPVRAAFARLAADHQAKRCSGNFKYVYEELLFTCREMDNGITEMQAYEHFGQRCRLSQYRKCMALLTAGMQKGSAGLLHALQEEAEQSFQERKRSAREEGERAGTKLLLPMMMMLAVVMVLIMVPACFSFSGIG